LVVLFQFFADAGKAILTHADTSGLFSVNPYYSTQGVDLHEKLPWGGRFFEISLVFNDL